MEKLDAMEHKALVKALPRSDQFTVPIANSEVQVLDIKRQEPRGGALAGFGDVKVRSQVVAYKLMRRFKDRMGRWTTEQLTTAEVDCQEQSLTTQAYWLQVPRQTQLQLEQQNLWRDSDNEYGPLWQERRPRCGQNAAPFALTAASPKREGCSTMCTTFVLFGPLDTCQV